MASSVSIEGQRSAIVALGYEMATNLGTYLMLSLGLQVSTLQTKGA
jgi:hypothetical protein